MLSTENVQQLKASLRGAVIQPGDGSYDQARKIYNGMIDKHPALIAQCRDIADVISAVNFGRDNKLDIAIRSGGHHGAGLSLVDNGLVIDLSLMKGIRVDPKAKTVRAPSWLHPGGCRPRHACLWHGYPYRYRFNYWSRWVDPGRWVWQSHPHLWFDD